MRREDRVRLEGREGQKRRNSVSGVGGGADEMYSRVLLEHFENPRNLGEIPSPDAAATVRNPEQGDTLRITMRIDGGRIAEVRFKAFGCPVTIAAGSLATEMLAGMTIQQALELTDAQVADALGGVPEERIRCSVLVQKVIRRALGSLVAG